MIHSKIMRERAHQVLKICGVKTIPINVDEVARKLGFIITEADLPETTDSVVYISKQGKVIGINKDRSRQRKRFSIAHEIGHFIGGHDDYSHEKEFSVAELSNQIDPQSRYEMEANEFAAELLMPKHFLEKEFKAWGLDVRKLAHCFEVSEQAMWIQLMNYDYAEASSRKVKI